MTHLRRMGDDLMECEVLSTYIVSTAAPMAWSSSAFCAIDAATGEQCVAIKFKLDERRRLVHFFLSYGRRLRHTHLARCLKLQYDPPLLVQPFHGRDFLRPGSISADTACTVIQQITDALHTAHGMGLIHGHMKAEDIVYRRAGLRYHFVLNGFWRGFIDDPEIKIPRTCSDTDKKHDYRVLSELVTAGLLQSSDMSDHSSVQNLSHHLSLMDDSIKDYTLREVLLAMKNTRTVDITWAYIQDLPQCHGDSFFSMIEVTRSISAKLHGTGRNAELQKSQLIRIWENYLYSTRVDRDITEVEDIRVLRLLRNYRSDFIRATKFLTFLRLAASDTVHLRAALDTAVKRSAATVNFEISIRIPSIGELTNITCFARATGTRILDTIDLPPDAVQEVRGLYSHAGLYVNPEVLKDILSHNTESVDSDHSTLTWRSQRETTTFSQKVYDVSARDYVLFATGLPWCAIVLMRRKDGMLDWDPFSKTSPTAAARSPLITVEESCFRCDKLGLSNLKQAILDFNRAPCRDLPPFHTGEKLEFATQIDGESDTSVETDESDQDHLKFRRKRV